MTTWVEVESSAGTANDDSTHRCQWTPWVLLLGDLKDRFLEDLPEDLTNKMSGDEPADG